MRFLFKQNRSLVFGLLMGILGTYTYQEFRSHHLAPFPYLQKSGYDIVYDTRYKIPMCVREHLRQEDYLEERRASRKGMNFYEDSEVYPVHQSTLSDYAHSGFDRGHLMPAADAMGSSKILKDTFCLSNICPQTPAMNRGIWKSLEKHVRDMLNSYEYIDVITGPLFLSYSEGDKKYIKFEVIRTHEVAVPTHFFKWIKNSQGDACAYVIPNISIFDDDGSLEDYQYSIDQLEAVSGMRF